MIPPQQIRRTTQDSTYFMVLLFYRLEQQKLLRLRYVGIVLIVCIVSCQCCVCKKNLHLLQANCAGQTKPKKKLSQRRSSPDENMSCAFDGHMSEQRIQARCECYRTVEHNS